MRLRAWHQPTPPLVLGAEVVNDGQTYLWSPN